MTVEFRNPIAFTIGIAFAGITTLSINLVSGGTVFSPMVTSMLLWIILFFSAMNSLASIFIREQEEGTALFLTLHSRAESIFLSKLVFNTLFFIALELIITPLFLFFMQLFPDKPAHFATILLAGGLAISSSTTLLGAMVSKAGGKGALFTILSFPLLLPIIWIAIIETTRSLQKTADASGGNLVFLLAFSGLVMALSYLLFRFVWYSD